MTYGGGNIRRGLMLGGALVALATTMVAAPAMADGPDNQAQIVPNDNLTPSDVIDNVGGVNGVGMFFRNDGFVCSGTLINPRTVLFAAHCVDDRPESDYGPAIKSAFSFGTNALPGFQNWIGNGFASNPDLFVYNINQIFYNPAAVQRPESFGFLEGDIALASLDSPAANVPTWALLFSALPTPESIDPVTGTGYHVNITGYGRSGSGTGGDTQGIDWRRRAAENMLGALTSFDARNTFLFGDPFGDMPQVLYHIDFDDPNKTNPFDFNLYKDEPLPNEATTAGGDSGGPLILDAASNPGFGGEDLVIGTLSGGSRFFGPQVFSSYGTESFYQPLFLFWDYIAENNPYRYVSANAGDGNWEDPSHWTTDLDPAYRVIDSNGNVVNGIPTTLGDGILGDTPQWGEVCFDNEGDNLGDECQDLSTGDTTPPARNQAGADLQSGIGQVDPASLASDNQQDLANEAQGSVAVAINDPSTGPRAASLKLENESQRDGLIAENRAQGDEIVITDNALPPTAVEFAINSTQSKGVEFVSEAPQNHNVNPAPVPTPAATLANGLPGATNFVPDNLDPASGSNGTRRYFEVTLNKAGVTTLSSAKTIDRLNVGGAAALNIAAAGDLTAVNDVNQTGGRVVVDGALTSVGDYSMFSGVLSGAGTVKAPFLTNMAGAIAPGTMGTTDTLTIDGNLILASASSLLIDLTSAGASDRVDVTGMANVGGQVLVNFNGRVTSNDPMTFRILNATGGVTGAFDGGVGNASAVLQGSLIYSADAVDLMIQAASYSTVVDPNNQVQTSYAKLLDDNRGNASLVGLYDVLDYVPTSAGVQAVLDSLAPTTETAQRSLMRGMMSNISNFQNNRMNLSSRDSTGGTIAVTGQPLQMAQASMTGMPGQSRAVQRDAGMGLAPSTRTSGGINENMAIYLAGGYIDGKGNAMPVTGGLPNDHFDGYFISGGVEFFPSDGKMLGGSLYYSDVDADVALGNSASGRMIAGSLYGRIRTASNWLFDGQFNIGSYRSHTLRNVVLGPTAYQLQSKDDNMVWAAEFGVSKELPIPGGVLTPGVDLRYTNANFGPVTETGGLPALTINRPDYESLQGRAGLTLNSDQSRPLWISGKFNYVHEFQKNPTSFAANLVGGQGASVPFALASDDRNWGEFGLGLHVNKGNIKIDLSTDFSINRKDVASQVYQGAITFLF